MKTTLSRVDIEEAKAKFPTLSTEQIKSRVPSVFTEVKNPRMSEHYVHIPTSRLLNDLTVLGWECIEAVAVKRQKKSAAREGYQKHMLRFRNYNYEIEGGLFPEIILTNSHEGTSQFVFRAGLYRFVCSNGLVIADAEFGQVKVRHMGYSFEVVKEAAAKILESIPLVVDKIVQLQSIDMTDEQMAEYALAAQNLRWSTSPGYVDVDSLLEAKRTEDEGNNLWVVYNRIQEKLMNGGYNNSKGRTVRKVKNFNQQIQLNEDLWKLTEKVINGESLIMA
jgi:hypothetical protein